MADTVEITPGTGAVIGTDEVTIGGTLQQVQRVKLVDGTDGGTDLLPGTAARGLSVDPRPLVARKQVSSSGLTTATTAYTSGDQLGALIEVTNAVRSSGATGLIQSAVLDDAAGVVGAVDAYFFTKSVTAAADNAAADFSDSDRLHCLGRLRFPSGDVFTSGRLATIENAGLFVSCAATSLFVALVTRSAHTFFGAAADLRLTLGIIQD